MKNKKSVWDTLSAIDVNDHTEKKGNLTYLSWAWAWGIVKSHYPSATYKVYRNVDTKQQWDYQEGVGYMCSTTVTIENESLEMWLPVMDNRNNSKVNNATTFDINKTIMRCLTKNLAMFGLGHYIYAGEDLPDSPTESLSVNSTSKKLDLGLPNNTTTATVPSDDKIISTIGKYHSEGKELTEIYDSLINKYPELKNTVRLTNIKKAYDGAETK